MLGQSGPDIINLMIGIGISKQGEFFMV